ncbi:MAG TPA: copper resistance CopC family protein, partial [Candidatus Binatia bacterium]|nr:copper resistance CopC family protein [Candidatus Binatia bacterium]
MRSRLFLALVALVASLASPSLALAHAELVSAEPGPGDEVVGSPTQIVANFSQNLDMSRTAMEVRNAAGETVAEGPVRGEGQRQIVLALPELAPGEYEVRWTTFSAEDNELHRGRYSFT